MVYCVTLFSNTSTYITCCLVVAKVVSSALYFKKQQDCFKRLFSGTCLFFQLLIELRVLQHPKKLSTLCSKEGCCLISIISSSISFILKRNY